MTAYTANMNQSATYWAPGVNDGVGGVVFEVAPVLLACRWQNKNELFRDSSGEQVTSSAVVYPDRALEQGGWLALGSFEGDVDSDGLSDPRDNDVAMEIKAAGVSPSLSGAMELHKVWL